MINTNVHLFHKPQIDGLIAEKTLMKVPVKYADFAFSLDLAFKLPKHITTILSN